MERNYPKTRLFTYILSIVLLAFSANVNFDIVRHYFMQTTVLYNYLDFVFFDRVWSAIIATTLLLFTYHKFSAKKIIIFFSMLYILAQVNMVVAMNENVIRFFYFLLTTSGFALFVFLVSLMLVETKVREEMNLTIFFAMVILGFLCSEVANYYLLSSVSSATLNRVMGLNILPISILIFVFTLNSSFTVNKRKQLPNFYMTFRFSELESMVVFGIFFTLMTLFEERNILEVKHSLVHFSESSTWHYFSIGILVLIYPVTYFAKKILFHELNLTCLLTLIAGFSMMQIWEGHEVLGLVIWSILALSMYLLFCSNIMMLFKKFKLAEMFGVLMFLFFIAAIGLYTGHISAVNVDQMLGESTSTSGLSISIVIGTIFVYYLFRFKKDKLYHNEPKQ